MTEPKKPAARKPRAKKAAPAPVVKTATETPVNGPVTPVEAITAPAAPKTLEIRTGDSWWTVAARSLNIPNTMQNYVAIEMEKRRLQPLNPDATLLPGTTINL